MTFGNFKVKADFGGARVTDCNTAIVFMNTLPQTYLNKLHWKLAETALQQGHGSERAEADAGHAFKGALEAEDWLEIWHHAGGHGKVPAAKELFDWL